MKKFFGVIILVCLVSFMTCDSDNNNGNESITIHSLSVKDISIKSLYVSNISISGNGRASVSNDIQTLSYINNLGQNTPFFFVSPSGKNIVLEVIDLWQDDKIIFVDFISFYEITTMGNVYTVGETVSSIGSALINMETGKVYDFSEYKNIQLIYNDLLFSLENKTLYRIDLNNISTAIPLNNSTYIPLINYLQPPVVINNKLICYIEGTLAIDPPYCFDINNDYPPAILQDHYITINEFSARKVDFYSSFTNGVFLLDLYKNPWFFYRFEDKYFIGKININNTGKVSITDNIEDVLSFVPKSFDDDGEGDYRTPTFLINSAYNGKIGSMIIYGERNTANKEYYRNNGMVLIYKNGFIRFNKKTNGIQVESAVLPNLPTINQYNSFIKDNYLYYIDGISIKRIYLGSGSSSETVYTNQRLFMGGTNRDSIIMSGNNIIFYQFADDNISVYTYSMPFYSKEPKLLSTSTVEIKYIIELDF